MTEFNIKISAPELTTALAALADAIKNAALFTSNVGDIPFPLNPEPPATPNSQDILAPQPVPAVPDIPATTVASAVPIASAPTYSHGQLQIAGAALIDAGKMSELVGLLNTFGVQAVTQLGQEQLGAFATELRKLGAQI